MSLNWVDEGHASITEGPRARLIELVFLTAVLAVAIACASLTLQGAALGEGLRAIARRWVNWVRQGRMLKQTNRYEFGAGKVEQAGILAIALALVAVGFWLTTEVLKLLLTGETSATPQHLALAAAVYAIFTVRDGLSVVATLSPTATRTMPMDKAHARNSALRLLSSLVLLAIMTTAAIVRDPVIGPRMDAVGALLIAVLITPIAVVRSWEAIADLIDHPLDSRLKAHIEMVLRNHGATAPELSSIRSRRSGQHTFVELSLVPKPNSDCQRTHRHLAEIRQRLEREIDGIDISIRLRAQNP